MGGTLTLSPSHTQFLLPSLSTYIGLTVSSIRVCLYICACLGGESTHERLVFRFQNLASFSRTLTLVPSVVCVLYFRENWNLSKYLYRCAIHPFFFNKGSFVTLTPSPSTPTPARHRNYSILGRVVFQPPTLFLSATLLC